MANEVWKPIPDYEDLYAISDRGRIWSVRNNIYLKPEVVKQGYHRYTLVKDGNKQRYSAHRLVLLTFCDPPPEGKTLVCHRNDIPDDNRVENLYWGSYSDNMADKIRNGNHSELNKTHCPRGHLLRKPNLRHAELTKRGRRGCLSCSRAQTFASNNSLDFDPNVADMYYEQLMRKEEQH